MPTYNRADYLKEAIECVLAQTFTDWELFVVDDGSTDQTEELVRAHALKDERISYLKQANAGCSVARNTGLRHARGLYVAFLDDDDRWLPEKLEVQAAYLDSRPEIGFCYTRFQIFRLENGKRVLTKTFPEFLTTKFEEIPDVFIVPSTVMMHKPHFDALGGFNPRYRYAEDFDLWLRYAQRWQIGPIDRALVFTVMDNREHGGRDQILVNEATSAILKNLELTPRYRNCKRLIREEIAIRRYDSGREYLGRADYWQALKYFAMALFTDPLVGIFAHRPGEPRTPRRRGMEWVRHFGKAYAAILVCARKGLFNTCPWRRSRVTGRWQRSEAQPSLDLMDLAVFGGKPAFGEPLHVGCPNIGARNRLQNRMDDILNRRWLTNNGCYVREFEQRICDVLGVKHCIAICNGTVALEIAIRALGLVGEVIVPSFTAPATVHALSWLGIKPVFCDIDPETLCLDPKAAEKKITSKTTGILAVHLFGRPCDVKALEEISAAGGLKLLYDSAHAFGCSVGGRMIGNFGNAEVFSFHATKFLNAFEGGAVVTNDDSLAERLRLMRNFGYTDSDKIESFGTNGKMSEISAAMGITSLESMDEFVRSNRLNFQLYQEGLEGIPGIALMPYDLTEKNNFQYVVLDVDEEAARISRDALIQVLRQENVLARRYFHPGCHRMRPYLSVEHSASLPITERVSERLLQLPTGTSIGPSEIKTVCEIIKTAVEGAEEICAHLERKARVLSQANGEQKTYPAVSIIIPTYNRPSYLAKAIESIRDQAYKDWELIVVDDGSVTGDIKTVVEHYTEQDDRIRYIRRPNGSWYRARNTGIRNARGKYIAFLDDDDYWLKEKLEKQVAFMDAHPEIGINYTLFQVYRSRNGRSEPAKVFPRCSVAGIEGFLDAFVPISAVMIRRACLDGMRWFPARYPISGDFEFYLRFARHWPVGGIEEILTATTMDERDHAGKDLVLVYHDSVKVLKDLKGTRDFSKCRWLLTWHMALRYYLLARFFLDQGSYWKAAEYFLHALLANPLVGLAVRRPEEKGLKLGFRVVKAYAAVLVCAWKGFFCSGRHIFPAAGVNQ